MDAHQEPDQRVGKPPDAAALAAVTIEAFATYREWAPDGWSPQGAPGEHEAGLLHERLSLPGYWCRMAEAGGEAIGYVVLRPSDGLGHIWHLFVRPAWWGRGLAPSLLDAALGEARRRGYTTARLWTPRDNARARAFYEREGWYASGAEDYAPDLDLPLVEYRRPLEG
jgi:ribosomal protein S18 acetylase RimI-like enzyme